MIDETVGADCSNRLLNLTDQTVRELSTNRVVIEEDEERELFAPSGSRLETILDVICGVDEHEGVSLSRTAAIYGAVLKSMDLALDDGWMADRWVELEAKNDGRWLIDSYAELRGVGWALARPLDVSGNTPPSLSGAVLIAANCDQMRLVALSADPIQFDDRGVSFDAVVLSPRADSRDVHLLSWFCDPSSELNESVSVVEGLVGPSRSREQ